MSPAWLDDTPRQRWVFIALTLAGVAIFGFATGRLMAADAALLGDRLAELTCLQLAFTPERAGEILAAFSPEQRAAIGRLLVPADMVFAWGYGLQFTGLLGLLTLRLPATWKRVGAWLIWAPLGASALDCLEDLLLHQLAVAADPATLGGAVPLLAGLAASLKYLLLSVVAPAYGIAGVIKGLATDRRPGALLIYALVVVTAVSFLARPLQQIPACFP